MLTEIVYNGYNDPVSIFVRERTTDIPLDFIHTTRMVLKLEDQDTVIDSLNDFDLIDWNRGGGEIVFKLNDLEIPEGHYKAWLIVYDFLHPSGQVLIDPEVNNLSFQFKNVP